MEVAPLETDEEPLDELIARRIKAFERKRQRKMRHRRRVTLPAEPLALYIAGDPHVDDDGCDMAQLQRHATAIRDVPNLYGACVGDLQNNWIGRLARLWAEESLSAREGVRLAEWYLGIVKWLAMIGGNHDKWASTTGFDPLEFLCDKHNVRLYAPDQLRIEIAWQADDLPPLEVLIRHYFKGHSWFHPTHGANKEAMLDGRAHVFAAGHIHEWGELTTEQRHGRVTNAISVRGFKYSDDYAMEKQFFEQQHGAACLVTIDPKRAGPGQRQVWWDIEEGVDFHLDRVRRARR